MQLLLKPRAPLWREAMAESEWKLAQVHVLRLLGWQEWQLLAPVRGKPLRLWSKLAGVQALVEWQAPQSEPNLPPCASFFWWQAPQSFGDTMT